jgi:prolyl 4-hydroxylase
MRDACVIYVFHMLTRSDPSLNRNELCAFWTALGECQNNQAFMLTNCAPSCGSCHLIDMGARCPELPDQVPALKPGDLNKMFEMIVRDAPGNKTLTSDERKELNDRQIPEYTVTVHSRPSSSPAIEVSATLEKALPPWLVTFDNFLSPEECQELIDLGYEAVSFLKRV